MTEQSKMPLDLSYVNNKTILSKLDFGLQRYVCGPRLVDGLVAGAYAVAVEIIGGAHLGREREMGDDGGLQPEGIADALTVEHGDIIGGGQSPLIGILATVIIVGVEITTMDVGLQLFPWLCMPIC